MQVKSVESLIKDIQSELIVSYPFLAQWSVTFDKAKKRAGVCRVLEKSIGVSYWHIEHNPEEVVKDTILHEFAHAITYELYDDIGHGARWKQIAREIGASPRATGQFNLPDSPWMLVTINNDDKSIVKLAPRFRRSKKIKHYYVKGKPETKGKLYFIRTDQLAKFEANQMMFEELEFVQ